MSDAHPNPEDTDPENTIDENTIDEPVLDGAEDRTPDADPRKGKSDPALIRDVESGKKTVNPYG